MLANIALTDQLLEEMRTPLGPDYDRYRNHVYRVINFTDHFFPLQGEALEQVAIAAAFHDAGIWLDHTFDYLAPSCVRAQEYARSKGHGDWESVIGAMILNHHRLRPIRGNQLVEAFRRADWLDVSQGLINFGAPSDLMAALKRQYPVLGFHARLAQLTLLQARKNPLNPLPMIRW